MFSGPGLTASGEKWYFSSIALPDRNETAGKHPHPFEREEMSVIEYEVDFNLDLIWSQLVGYSGDADEMAEQLYAHRKGWA